MKVERFFPARSSTSSLSVMQAGLTVRQIMTARDNLVCCAPQDSLRHITGNNPERYSYIPVRKNDSFLGLLHAEPWFDSEAPDGLVDDHYCPIGESELIGADASITDFVLNVADQPCRLVVAGTRIEGLVSISDLQQLPVRAALFGLVTGLELALADAIRAKFTSTETWMGFLSTDRQRKIYDQIEDSKGHDGFVDALLFTQFADKKSVLRKGVISDLSGISGRQYDNEMNDIQRLRDALAHANEYAATPEHGRNVSQTVANIFRWHEIFSKLTPPDKRNQTEEISA